MLFVISVFKKNYILTIFSFLVLLCSFSIILELLFKATYIAANIILLGVGAILMIFLYTLIILGLDYKIIYNKSFKKVVSYADLNLLKTFEF
jgi:hypothetical protein